MNRLFDDNEWTDRSSPRKEGTTRRRAWRLRSKLVAGNDISIHAARNARLTMTSVYTRISHISGTRPPTSIQLRRA